MTRGWLTGLEVAANGIPNSLPDFLERIGFGDRERVR
jgi:hypothetical protein